MIGANRTNMLTDWPKEAFPVPTLEAPEDPDGTWMMPFSPKIIGSPILPAIHGGLTGAFLETAAIVGVTRELGAAAPPKPIGLTINYLRPGCALDTYANVSIVKQGGEVAGVGAGAGALRLQRVWSRAR
jgi:acyl-coenzyme A thioesterase PaaI-like protein